MKLFPLHLIPNDTKIDFLRTRYVAMTVVVLLVIASLIVIGTFGFRKEAYALEFTGGTLVETAFEKPADVEQVRQKLAAAGFENAQVQGIGGGNGLMIRLQPHGESNNTMGDKTIANQVVQAVSTAENPARVLRSEFVGPQVGADLVRDGIYATLFMLVGFVIYIAFRFELKFALVASLTAFFDLIVTAAYIYGTGREFDLTVLAGLLSVMGFAINDIIVVFDRVRENFRTLRVDSMEVLNRSINQTLSRTVITAVMFFLSAWALYLYGGSSMEGLALTHMVGAVVVVVSTIFVAVPMLSLGPFKVTKQDLLPKAKDEAALARRP
ncbi:protein translocase subunit SecF [Lysobacter sp. LF1]|uniref:Protein-export membrane protein SecF n=1 Tax=Lysobacter stagni TaxID=3045172 RepID=A0ABT6XKH8_9GAMM|nr:protein translocase subunit SecF [Lysobacter sp. LF1]MDI9240675.1 protein translocase subunit SecF [Lysobacter sp. LF1]